MQTVVWSHNNPRRTRGFYSSNEVIYSSICFKFIINKDKTLVYCLIKCLAYKIECYMFYNKLKTKTRIKDLHTNLMWVIMVLDSFELLHT